ncbi:antitoxin [Agrobacterium tumefaciens]
MTDQQRQSLKANAALHGKTIKQYALERLFRGDAHGDLAWQQLKSLLSDSIDESIAGKVSARSVSEILDEELASDGRG